MNQDIVTLAENDLYTITFFRKEQILQIRWAHTPTPQEYREHVSKFMDLVHQHHIKKIISDSKMRGTLLPDDLLFITHELVPTLCEEEVKQLALVVPQDPNHARELECCLMTGDVCYELKFFHTQADALDWLRHQNGNSPHAAVA